MGFGSIYEIPLLSKLNSLLFQMHRVTIALSCKSQYFHTYSDNNEPKYIANYKSWDLNPYMYDPYTTERKVYTCR